MIPALLGGLMGGRGHPDHANAKAVMSRLSPEERAIVKQHMRKKMMKKMMHAPSEG